MGTLDGRFRCPMSKARSVILSDVTEGRTQAHSTVIDPLHATITIANVTPTMTVLVEPSPSPTFTLNAIDRTVAARQVPI